MRAAARRIVDELGLASEPSKAWLPDGTPRGGVAARVFSIELSGEFGALPRDFAASLYRIAQEAITNAAKHAQASRVTLSPSHAGTRRRGSARAYRDRCG